MKIQKYTYKQLLTTAYLPDEAFAVPKKTNNQATFNATLALNSVRRLPGFDPATHSIDTAYFNSWVMQVTYEAVKHHYSQANDHMLGTIFSYSPQGSDGI